MLDPRLARRGAGAARLALCQAAYVTHSHRSAHLSRPGSCPDGVYVSPDTNDALRTHATHSHRLERRRVRTIRRIRVGRVSVRHSVCYGPRYIGDAVRVFAPDPLASARRGASSLRSRSRATVASVYIRSSHSPRSTGGKRLQIIQSSSRRLHSTLQPASTTRSSSGCPRRGSEMSACIRTSRLSSFLTQPLYHRPDPL